MSAEIVMRRYPRIPIQTAARIVPNGGSGLNVTAIDLSHGGIKLACDREAAFSLLPDKHASPGSIQGVEAVLELTLPVENKTPRHLAYKCRVVNFYRRAENRFEIGCQFVDSDAEQQALMTGYMQQLA